MDLDTEWMNFIDNKNSSEELVELSCSKRSDNYGESSEWDVKNDLTLESSISKPPKCGQLYISTKTMIGYLQEEVELIKSFWNIPIIPYTLRNEGVIKKQIKFNSDTKDQVDIIIKKCEDYNYVNTYIMQHIDNPTGRIKFKDVRKITIGLSKKDIISYRIKQKSAFYNCFVVILRILIGVDKYKEFHVKVFNTGKLELPGIRSDEELRLVYKKLHELLSLNISERLPETVLINSNFNCGYYIKRDILYQILKHRYNISVMYDPCSYPGIQCKLYITTDDNVVANNTIVANNTTAKKNYISFMIFRTGSVLIVGKCTETILNNTYNYIVNILETEYAQIIDQNTNIIPKSVVVKKKKLRTIVVFNPT
jgi:TATA-box binding protein (TBP) (component of TFIID and TFIIIB)